MPHMILHVDALAHNSRMTARYSTDWGVMLLPVLKGVASHPVETSGGWGRNVRKVWRDKRGEPSGWSLHVQSRVLSAAIEDAAQAARRELERWLKDGG